MSSQIIFDSNVYALYGKPESIASVGAELWSGLKDSPVDTVEGILIRTDRKPCIITHGNL